MPRITRELPKFAAILRTTDGVRLLTPVVRQWDNAQHGRALCEVTGCASTVRAFRNCNCRVTSFVNESREVMNVRQASQYLGISPDTLYRYITEGEIPAFKLGNRWKLRKTILDRWMERKMSQVHARRR